MSNLEFASGSYTGDGTTGRAITGLGFAPKLVVVKGDDATPNQGLALARWSGAADARTVNYNFTNDGIVSLDADGFTVSHLAGQKGMVNVNLKVYYWYAFGGVSVVCGTYVGTGAVGNAITGIGFAPAMVWVVPSANAIAYRTAAMDITDTSEDFSTGNTQTLAITSLDADGFTVGTAGNMNALSTTYHYIAFAGEANFASGTYLGDDSDNRNLPLAALTSNPLLVDVKGSDSGQIDIWCVSSMPSNKAASYGDSALAADRIQSLTPAPGQFQVGTDDTVNASWVTRYFWFAITDAADVGGDRAISVAASLVVPGRAVYGTDLGAIFVTSDLLATVPLQAMATVGSPIVDIEWDRVTVGRVWAVSYDARVFVSNDYGQTWTLSVDLRAGGAGRFLNRIDSVFISRTLCLRIFGGDGDGRPFMAWTLAPSIVWTEFAIGGELAADLAGTSEAALYAADGASEVSTELAIILNSAVHTPAVYFTTDAFGDGATWLRATGAPAKSRGRWLDADLERSKFAFAFDDTVIYLGDVAGGVMAVTTAAAALTAGDAPNHGLWLGRAVPGLAGVYAVAAEGAFDGSLYKTTDRFATIGKTRPATGVTAVPVGGDAKMVAVPKARPGPRRGLALYAQQSPLSATQETYADRVGVLAHGSWALTYNPAEALRWPVQFTRSFNGVMFRSRGPNAGAGGQKHPGNLERSTNQGVTWAEVFAMQTDSGDHWGVQGLDRAGTGRLYLCAMSDDPSNLTLPAPRIYYSDDDGATWTQSFEDATLDGGLRRQMIDIACHPVDPQKIHVIGGTGAGARRSWYTATGGASWTAVTDGAPTTVASCERQIVMLSNDRVLLMDGDTGTMRYSDDQGSTWVTPLASPMTVMGSATLFDGTWNDPENVTALDGAEASVQVGRTFPFKTLEVYGMGFQIPSAATILGIGVRVYCRAAVESSWQTVSALEIRLRDAAGNPIGSDKAGSDIWPVAGAYKSYGGPSDLWGAAWTPADINDADFGLHLVAQTSSVSIRIYGYIDHVEIKVTYQEANTFATVAYQLMRNLAGTLAWACGGSSTVPVVRWTADYGASWQVHMSEARLSSELAPSVVDAFSALAHDASRDVLYIGTDAANSAIQKVVSVAEHAGILVGALADETVNLNNLFTATTTAHRRVSRQGLVVL